MQGRLLGASSVHGTGTDLDSEFAVTLPLAARRDDVDDRPGSIAPPAVHDGRRRQCRCRADLQTMSMVLHQVRKRYLPKIAEIIRSAQKIIVARFPYFIISPRRNSHAASDAAPMVHIVRLIAFQRRFGNSLPAGLSIIPSSFLTLSGYYPLLLQLHARRLAFHSQAFRPSIRLYVLALGSVHSRLLH